MLKGKVAIITGSTSGIGAGIANNLAAVGCNIMLNGFGNEDEINKLRSSLSAKYKVKVEYDPADISKADQVTAMVQRTEKEFGQLDVLVNNAGIQYVSPCQDFPTEKWDAIIAINLSGAFHAMKAALPGMQKRNFGRIINIASAHGLVGSVNKSAYVAAKHGIVGLTKVVALENATMNITANAICPGWVHTPLVQKQIEEKAKKLGISIETATNNMLNEKQPSARFVSTEEIGKLVLFLSSESGRSITGVALPIDGGWTAQ